MQFLPNSLSFSGWFQNDYSFISTSTPAARSSFMSASTVCGVGSRMSISRLCVLISNCSLDFLSTWGERSTVQRLILVGNGMGPDTFAPVLLAVSMISTADWSSSLWSYPFNRILIFCVTCYSFPLYSMTSVITPAPTVLPPSRMANRSSLSIAIGVISSTEQLMLSPGITISTPSASFTTPVTSVVRK